MSNPFILVDDRQADWFPKALERAGFSVRVKRLATGDLVWDSPNGRVGIEDKCVDDLLKSHRNKRLDDELRRLTAEYPVPVLFVRGDLSLYDELPQDGYDGSAIDNLLFGRQMHGALLARCHTDRPTAVAERLRRLYDYTQKARAMEGKRREFSYLEPMDDRAELLYAVFGLTKGVKNRREVARSMAEHHSLRDVLSWTSAADWRSRGWSKVMSEKLAELVRNL